MRCWKPVPLTNATVRKNRLEALREEQMAKGEKPRYDGRCRHSHEHHADDEPCVVRFANPQEGSVIFDDQIRRTYRVQQPGTGRSDHSPYWMVPSTHNFWCVVVDDWDMAIINADPRRRSYQQHAAPDQYPQSAGAGLCNASMINGDDGKNFQAPRRSERDAVSRRRLPAGSATSTIWCARLVSWRSEIFTAKR